MESKEIKYLVRQNEPMAELGFVKLLGAFGLPLFLLGWITDPDSLKSWISYVAGGVMGVVWFCFKCDRWYHEWWLRREERRNLRRKRRN